jgi:hypothetical protein
MRNYAPSQGLVQRLSFWVAGVGISATHADKTEAIHMFEKYAIGGQFEWILKFRN